MFLHNLWLCLHWHQSGLEMWAVPPCQGKYTCDAWGQRARLSMLCSFRPYRNTIITASLSQSTQHSSIWGFKQADGLFALVTAVTSFRHFHWKINGRLHKTIKTNCKLVMGYYSGNKCHFAKHCICYYAFRSQINVIKNCGDETVWIIIKANTSHSRLKIGKRLHYWTWTEMFLIFIQNIHCCQLFSCDNDLNY